MRSGIGNAVFIVIMRKIIITAAGITTVKGKFQYLHIRESTVLDKLTYAVRHKSEIFCNDLTLSECRFNGEESRAGTLFLDFRNRFDVIKDGKRMYDNSEHLVIYGHNMADESMFGKLKYYYGSEEYYMEHPIIQLNSNYETYKYKIFAIFIVDAKDESETKYDCWNQLELDTEEEFYNLVNEAKRRTIYTNDVDVKYGDGLLSLSTCHYLLKDRSRLMIMARTIRPGEDEYEGTQNSKRNDNIKWPTMYYNSKKDEKYDEDAIFIPYGPEEAVKEAEAKLAAEKKKKEEEKKKKEQEKKKKEQASKEAEKSKNTTTTKKVRQ